MRYKVQVSLWLIYFYQRFLYFLDLFFHEDLAMSYWWNVIVQNKLIRSSNILFSLGYTCILCNFRLDILKQDNCDHSTILILGMTAPCEILEYELHLTLEQIKEEPVDNADSTQVRICRNRNKYFYLLNAHPWNNVWLLPRLQILSQHVWKKNFIHKVHCSSNFLHL